MSPFADEVFAAVPQRDRRRTWDTWLLWNLTGGPRNGLHQTDVTNASRTQLMNLTMLQWDDELLAAFEIPRAVLPVIKPSSHFYGDAVIEPIRGTRIAGIVGDQQAALLGQTCFGAGEVKNTYGTGCFLLMNTGERRVRSASGLVAGRPRRPHQQLGSGQTMVTAHDPAPADAFVSILAEVCAAFLRLVRGLRTAPQMAQPY